MATRSRLILWSARQTISHTEKDAPGSAALDRRLCVSRASRLISMSKRLALERLAVQTPFLTIYRITADLVMADLTIDPDDRIAGGDDGHPRPDLQNWSTSGLPGT